MPDSITITRHFDAAPERVFDAWTTPSEFAEWFGGESVTVPLDTLDYQPAVGRQWSAQMLLPAGAGTIDWAGEFTEIDRTRRFALTLTDEPSMPERAPVTVDLSAGDGGGTDMSMTQQTPGWSQDEVDRLRDGYGTFFDVMERLVTGQR